MEYPNPERHSPGWTLVAPAAQHRQWAVCWASLKCRKSPPRLWYERREAVQVPLCRDAKLLPWKEELPCHPTFSALRNKVYWHFWHFNSYNTFGWFLSFCFASLENIHALGRRLKKNLNNKTNENECMFSGGGE